MKSVTVVEAGNGWVVQGAPNPEPSAMGMVLVPAIPLVAKSFDDLMRIMRDYFAVEDLPIPEPFVRAWQSVPMPPLDGSPQVF